jgi:putative serine protease PepD
MNPDSAGHRLLRRGAPIAAAAVIGAATGAGVYALSSGDSHPSSSTATATAVVPAQPAAKTTTPTPTTLTQLYKDDTPGVVDITVKSTTAGGSSFGNPNFGNPGGQQTEAEGSGFEIDGKGDILTNEHVVDGATSITVHFHDGTTAKGTLVGSDKSTDVAVVKVDVPASQLHPLTLGNSSTVQPGQAVVAIGSPFGLPGSMTSGIVSAVNRTITAPNGFSIAGAIQTDAAINHGNSGGPLIDIATNSVIDAAKSVADTLIAGGTVQHPYLGVTVGDATSGSGAQVGCVVTNGPADKAGLKAGDVITKVDGTAVADADALTANLSGRAPGNSVTLTVVRDGSTKTVDVTLGSRPSSTQNNCSQ